MKSNAWIKSKASGTIWIPQVRCFAIPTHLMAIMLATQALDNKNQKFTFLTEGSDFPCSYTASLFVLEPFLCYNERYES